MIAVMYVMRENFSYLATSWFRCSNSQQQSSRSESALGRILILTTMWAAAAIRKSGPAIIKMVIFM